MVAHTGGFPGARKFGRGGSLIASTYCQRTSWQKLPGNINTWQKLYVNANGFWGQGCNLRVTASFSRGKRGKTWACRLIRQRFQFHKLLINIFITQRRSFFHFGINFCQKYPSLRSPWLRQQEEGYTCLERETAKFPSALVWPLVRAQSTVHRL